MHACSAGVLESIDALARAGCDTAATPDGGNTGGRKTALMLSIHAAGRADINGSDGQRISHLRATRRLALAKSLHQRLNCDSPCRMLPQVRRHAVHLQTLEGRHLN
jgi:hypothetical protein